MAHFALKDLPAQLRLAEAGAEVWRVVWIVETLYETIQAQDNRLHALEERLADLTEPDGPDPADPIVRGVGAG